MSNLKIIKLSKDDLLLGFKKNDEVVIDLSKPPVPGSLVIIFNEGDYQICRYEKIDGTVQLWPPKGISPDKYQDLILGQAIELSRTL